MSITEERMKYEKYWEEKTCTERFQNYERNLILPRVFPQLAKGSRVRVLDAGGGDGVVSEFLVRRGYNSVLVDVSVEACQKARGRGLQVMVADAQFLPCREESFDVVWGGDIVEHLFVPMKFVNEAFRVTGADGEIIVSCPNIGYWGYRLHYILFGAVAKTEGSPNDPWDWEHIRFFNLKILRMMLKKGGFIMKEVHGSIPGTLFRKKLAIRYPTLFASIITVRATKISIT